MYYFYCKLIYLNISTVPSNLQIKCNRVWNKVKLWWSSLTDYIQSYIHSAIQTTSDHCWNVIRPWFPSIKPRGTSLHFSESAPRVGVRICSLVKITQLRLKTRNKSCNWRPGRVGNITQPPAPLCCTLSFQSSLLSTIKHNILCTLRPEIVVWYIKLVCRACSIKCRAYVVDIAEQL